MPLRFDGQFNLVTKANEGNEVRETTQTPFDVQDRLLKQRNACSSSEGPAPMVFVFNPFAEGYIAWGKSFTPVKQQAALAVDLSNLPQFLCRADDIVLIDQKPSLGFLNSLRETGFRLPKFVEMKQGRVDRASKLDRRKIGGLRPWAWGPDSIELLGPLFDKLTGGSCLPTQRYNAAISRLYSKAWSADFLREVLARHRVSVERESDARRSWLCTDLEVGIAVDSMDAALGTITRMRQSGCHRLVVKQALGLAGNNAIRLWEPELLPAQRRWLERLLAKGAQLVVEPWLERALDFSVQLEMTARGLKLCGYTGLINDRKGQFLANWAEPNYERGLPAPVAQLMRESPDNPGKLPRLFSAIFELLEIELRRLDFFGPIGIDAFVYRSSQRTYRLKPIVEINPRYTMGRLTLELMKKACPGSYGIFRLVNLAQLRSAGFGSLADYARALTERFPLQFIGPPLQGIRQGALCLNDPERAQVCLATFQVGPSLSQALGGLEINSP